MKNARAELVPITRDNFVSLLHIYRDGDINDSKYLASLFETFLVRVDLYDDHFLIWFNPLGQKTPADIPITSIENGGTEELLTNVGVKMCSIGVGNGPPTNPA